MTSLAVETPARHRRINHYFFSICWFVFMSCVYSWIFENGSGQVMLVWECGENRLTFNTISKEANLAKVVRSLDVSPSAFFLLLSFVSFWTFSGPKNPCVSLLFRFKSHESLNWIFLYSHKFFSVSNKIKRRNCVEKACVSEVRMDCQIESDGEAFAESPNTQLTMIQLNDFACAVSKEIYWLKTILPVWGGKTCWRGVRYKQSVQAFGKIRN